MRREQHEARTGGTAHLARQGWRESIARYLFGPEPAPPVADDAVLAEVRRLGGLVSAADVMRVTGLPRPRAEALLCRLLARQGGDVEVGRRGGVLYRFADVGRPVRAPAPIWDRPASVTPVTGNEPAVDLVLLFANLFVLATSATILFRTWEASAWTPSLALVPFLLALLTLALPLLRLRGQRARARAAAVENGRRGLLRAVLDRPVGALVGAHALSHAWAAASGQAIQPPRLFDELLALGGEPDLDEHARLQFRFVTLDEELDSAAQERALAFS